MAYITREDGERFVIPSYRDVISAKKTALLKKEILLLSSTHGEYITLHRKNIDQYEIAFSGEPGYLLGETVWSYFKRPQDLIYCEQIPNTSEAILVIVKAGSVYLDGSFPLDSIPDELIIFRTQQSNFDIYIYGDVPISQTPEDDKIALDSSSIRSFTVLEKPAFPTIPVSKAFKLQLVDVVLKEQGIGVFPVKSLLIGIILLVVLWFLWGWLTSKEQQIVVVPQIFQVTSVPYQKYMSELSSPDPAEEIRWLARTIPLLFTINGWMPQNIDYKNGNLIVKMISLGSRTYELLGWATQNRAKVDFTADGFILSISHYTINRSPPKNIYRLYEVVANITDAMSYIIPGNNMSLGKISAQDRYNEVDLKIAFDNISTTMLDLVGQQLKGLPLVLSGISISVQIDEKISGEISLKALGT